MPRLIGFYDVYDSVDDVPTPTSEYNFFLFSLPSGIYAIDGSRNVTGPFSAGVGGALLVVQEQDGTPTISNVDTLVFPNGSVTDNGGGSVSITISGGGGSGTDENAIHDNVASEIYTVASKPTPDYNDILLIEDSEDSYNKKRISLSQLPTISGTVSASASILEIQIFS